MKKYLVRIIAGLILITSNQVHAQDGDQKSLKEFEMNEVIYENKLRPSLEYTVDMDFKSLKNHWKDFIKKSYDGKVKIEDENNLVTKDVVVNSISDKRLNLLLVARPKGDELLVNFSAAFGYDIYIDNIKYPDESKALKTLVEGFLYDSGNMYYHSNLAELSKDIASLDKKNESLANANAKLNTKIIEIDTEAKILKESAEASSPASIKKLSKLAKKKVSYESKIAGNKNKILENHGKADKLKKEVALFKEKQKILNVE